ncbi:MAG: radical SAM protein [Candidatus Hodarchaeota archaeon]
MVDQEIVKFRKNDDICQNCGICSRIIQCPSKGTCIGCGACYTACPSMAFNEISEISKDNVKIIVNHKKLKVPQEITIKEALIKAGYTFTKDPTKKGIFAPCETGGCYACAVLVNGKMTAACHSGLKKGINIQTSIPRNVEPLRRVQGFQPHSVGGVGTPWQLKKKGIYIEVACFTAGCNFRCATCQNFTTTYNSKITLMTPIQAAAQLTMVRKNYKVDRMAISGGEPTLNRKWLIQFFEDLKTLNEDPKARLHLDTNASLLTKDYIDDLINAGITDIGPDLKSHDEEIFSKITGISDMELVKTYMSNAWSAVKYIVDQYYPDKIFVGIGLPYNKSFYPGFDQIHQWGVKLSQIDRNIQVSVLDYRPIFRNQEIKRPSIDEMLKVKNVLEGAGLKKVIVQTERGHIGP